MGTDGKGVERRQPADNALLSRQRSAHARLGRQPRRSRVAHIAVAQKQHRTPDDDGVRSRPWRSFQYCSMLPGWSLATRVTERNEIESVRQDERLKRFTSVCAAEYSGDLRPDQRFVPLVSPTSGTRTS